jgi:hypothetical protein
LEALRAYTHGSAWFSSDEDRKGTLTADAFADLAVLSDDYLTVDDHDIAAISSVLTMVGGRVVHGAKEFSHLAPPMPTASPDWSAAGAHVHVAPPPTGACTTHTVAQATAHQHARRIAPDPFAGACWAI